ncbi:MAG: hypothetical protein DHS80DRAFT_23379 [Piptocephalis tieghemiana]|nr:MAG: hypothetical protein DHS80DRAFT_23379 [Piptocephalis tieghemiana]
MTALDQVNFFGSPSARNRSSPQVLLVVDTETLKSTTATYLMHLVHTLLAFLITSVDSRFECLLALLDNSTETIRYPQFQGRSFQAPTPKVLAGWLNLLHEGIIDSNEPREARRHILENLSTLEKTMMHLGNFLELAWNSAGLHPDFATPCHIPVNPGDGGGFMDPRYSPVKNLLYYVSPFPRSTEQLHSLVHPRAEVLCDHPLHLTSLLRHTMDIMSASGFKEAFQNRRVGLSWLDVEPLESGTTSGLTSQGHTIARQMDAFLQDFGGSHVPIASLSSSLPSSYSLMQKRQRHFGAPKSIGYWKRIQSSQGDHPKVLLDCSAHLPALSQGWEEAYLEWIPDLKDMGMDGKERGMRGRDGPSDSLDRVGSTPPKSLALVHTLCLSPHSLEQRNQVMMGLYEWTHGSLTRSTAFACPASPSASALLAHLSRKSKLSLMLFGVGTQSTMIPGETVLLYSMDQGTSYLLHLNLEPDVALSTLVKWASSSGVDLINEKEIAQNEEEKKEEEGKKEEKDQERKEKENQEEKEKEEKKDQEQGKVKPAQASMDQIGCAKGTGIMASRDFHPMMTEIPWGIIMGRMRSAHGKIGTGEQKALEENYPIIMEQEGLFSLMSTLEQTGSEEDEEDPWIAAGLDTSSPLMITPEELAILNGKDEEEGSKAQEDEATKEEETVKLELEESLHRDYMNALYQPRCDFDEQRDNVHRFCKAIVLRCRKGPDQDRAMTWLKANKCSRDVINAKHRLRLALAERGGGPSASEGEEKMEGERGKERRKKGKGREKVKVELTAEEEIKTMSLVGEMNHSLRIKTLSEVLEAEMQVQLFIQMELIMRARTSKKGKDEEEEEKGEKEKGKKEKGEEEEDEEAILAQEEEEDEQMLCLGDSICTMLSVHDSLYGHQRGCGFDGLRNEGYAKGSWLACRALVRKFFGEGLPDLVDDMHTEFGPMEEDEEEEEEDWERWNRMQEEREKKEKEEAEAKLKKEKEAQREIAKDPLGQFLTSEALRQDKVKRGPQRKRSSEVVSTLRRKMAPSIEAAREREITRMADDYKEKLIQAGEYPRNPAPAFSKQHPSHHWSQWIDKVYPLPPKNKRAERLKPEESVLPGWKGGSMKRGTGLIDSPHRRGIGGSSVLYGNRLSTCFEGEEGKVQEIDSPGGDGGGGGGGGDGGPSARMGALGTPKRKRDHGTPTKGHGMILGEMGPGDKEDESQLDPVALFSPSRGKRARSLDTTDGDLSLLLSPTRKRYRKDKMPPPRPSNTLPFGTTRTPMGRKRGRMELVSLEGGDERDEEGGRDGRRGEEQGAGGEKGDKTSGSSKRMEDVESTPSRKKYRMMSLRS